MYTIVCILGIQCATAGLRCYTFEHINIYKPSWTYSSHTKLRDADVFLFFCIFIIKIYLYVCTSCLCTCIIQQIMSYVGCVSANLIVWDIYWYILIYMIPARLQLNTLDTSTLLSIYVLCVYGCGLTVYIYIREHSWIS